jgi:membrane protein DedA with SNARE-associated domain
MFEKHGFLTVAVGCALPPPVPVSPFFVAPGVLKYPLKKFLFAVLVGRSIRYTAIAYLASIYGRSVFHWMNHYFHPILYVLLGLLVVGAVVGLYYWRRFKQSKNRDQAKQGKPQPAHKVA